MDDGGEIERVIDDRNSPKPDVVSQPRLHRVIGNIAEGVVEEMREDVDEHHKAGDEPHLAYADAAQPCRKRSVHARADVTDSRGLGCHAGPSLSDD